MIQELIDLRQSIIEGRTDNALEIIDDLESMSQEHILQKIESFLVGLLVHLIKNNVEQRLTNYCVASMRHSLLKIQRLNLKANQTSYYINQADWDVYLEDAFEDAIFEACIEVSEGAYKPRQLKEVVEKNEVLNVANKWLFLTYVCSKEALRNVINEEFSKLPGGEDWYV